MQRQTKQDHILLFRFFSKLLRDEVATSFLSALQEQKVAQQLGDVLGQSQLLDVEQAGQEFV
ncbi:MAG: hypothetical protein R6Y91_03055, partial [Desulfohalobium sp.]